MGRKVHNECFLIKKETTGIVCAMQSPQNIEAVRQSFIRNPSHSVSRHSYAVGIFDLFVRKVLCTYPNFHLYKMIVEQELSDHGMANRSTLSEPLIRMLFQYVVQINY
jgi:hypothetical protein